MTYLSLFYIAAAIAQETTTQANDETTTVEPKKNNNCKFLNQLIVLFMVLSDVGINFNCTGDCDCYGMRCQTRCIQAW